MTTAYGTCVRQARLRYGMSQAELARRIGMSKTALNNLEKGQTSDPHISWMVAIADALHVSLDTLIGREGAGDEAGSETQPKRQRPRHAAPAAS